jgi:uncharacterized protein YbjT (DUF2867 family)
MTRVLVTGATGTVGGALVSQLLSADCRVRALARNPDAAAFPPEVEVARGDLTDADSLGPGLNDVDVVFLVWTAPAAAAPAAVRQIAARARRIVLLTAPHKTPHPFFQQPNPMRDMFVELERLIETSCAEWIFLRPGMFASNALAWWAPQILAGDVVRWPYAAAPTAPIDETDVAAVAVRALLDSGRAGADYVLTGPESLTHLEQVATIADVIGRSVRYEELSPEDAQRDLRLPTMLLDAWQAALGRPAYVTSTVRDVTAVEPRTFREWVRDHATSFRRPDAAPC